MTTTIPAITALPAVPNPNTPDTFETLGYPFTVAQAAMAVELEATRVAMNTVGGEVTTLANTATTQATAAEASNVAAAGNAAAAAASANAALWVTGTTYPVPSAVVAGARVYSPTNQMTYVDTVGGLSSTDPASDTTGRWISGMLPSAEAVGLPNLPPTAVLNFASGVIDHRFVEARTTAATRYNIFGNLEMLAAGVAKTTYDPATKEAKGYLALPATTYFAMRSSEIDNASYWRSSNATFTQNAHIGADGTLSAFKIEATATAVTAIVRVLTATATTYCFTVRAKKGSGATDFNIFGAYNITTGSDINFCSINYDTGAITQSFGSGATAREVANGYWEIKIPITVAIGNSFQVYLCTSSGVETAGKFAYIDTPTVSDQPNATPYPTDGSNVTTVAGGLTLDLTAHDEIINPAGFTVVLAVDLGPPTLTTRGILEIGDGTSSDRFTLVATPTQIRINQDAGGVSAASLTLNYVEGRNVIAFSYSADGSLLFCSSGQGVVSGTGAPGPVIPYLYVGKIFTPGFELGNPIEHITPFPRACTAGELRAFVNAF